MVRKLKALGLALVAVFAMTAMSSSAASAATGITTAEGAAIHGTDVATDPVKFTVTGREVVCNSSVYTGTAPSSSFTSLKVIPTYSECTGAGFSATITGFGAGECYFTLHIGGTADLHCDDGGDVTVDAATCITHIPPQTGLGTVTYTTGESGGKKDLTLDLKIQKIKETHTDGFLCPFEGSGTTETAELHGKVTATAAPFDLTDH